MRWFPVIPVALPLLIAALLVPADVFLKRRATDIIAIATAATVAVFCAFLFWESMAGTIVYWFGGWSARGNAAIGISFVVDPFGAGMALLCALMATVALVVSWRIFNTVRTLYHSLMLIFLAAMSGFSLTGDLFNLFVFFELMSVAAYALTGYKVLEKGPIEGAINFAVTNSIGAFALLTGIALLYGRTGALNMAQVGTALAGHAPDGLVILGLVLILTGFFIKGAIVPFHFWLADAHAVAPTPVCILFSGVMVELGFYGTFRVYWTVFHGAFAGYSENVRIVFLIMGSCTAVVGGIMCILQRHLKRLLAYSTISHMGIILVGAGVLSAEGLAGSAMYVLGHALVKASLFICAGILLHRFGSVDEFELWNRGRRLRLLGITMVISALGLAGFPPYGTYVGKSLIEEAGGDLRMHWIAAVLMASSVLTGAAVLRSAGTIFFGWGRRLREETGSPTEREMRETHEAGSRPTVMISLAVLLAVLPIAVGILPEMPTWFYAGSERFMDRDAYARTVLEASPTGTARLSRELNVTASGVLYSFSSATGAVLLAFALLFRGWIPGILRPRLSSMVQLGASCLRRIDSGRVTDYVTWITIGIAILGASFMFALT